MTEGLGVARAIVGIRDLNVLDWRMKTRFGGNVFAIHHWSVRSTAASEMVAIRHIQRTTDVDCVLNVVLSRRFTFCGGGCPKRCSLNGTN